MNDQVEKHDGAAAAASVRKVLGISAILVSLATALAACGGGGSDGAAPASVANNSVTKAAVTSTQIVPPNETFEGKTYPLWEAAFWQWALALPVNDPTLPHPFNDCNNRPISAGQSGDVWFWSAPEATVVCNQSATIIPAGKAIFLTTLDIEASSLDAPPFFATTAAGQLAIAQQFANYIQDLFVTIDGVPVANVTAYRTTTVQFTFTAPTPWIFNTVGGSGTSVGDGYFLMLQLPPGAHTIHYGGTFNIPKGVLGHKAVTIPMDVTLLVTMGG
ncbi:hypothetical protein A6V36_20585 [Paraburkholderia ginsengiterrae]|uniref:Uncharacterized protein n=1 Tax=Paraburkholderia ginsengiterrae TaxID=1462993 RepID=A0A1A9NCJ7_9BURK|nr:hypothetical protein [Paraburkholderia ginsengiterrae]OAJ62770.1 hypothetical protein A6V36_20585 [Paraburkholderia ginsengiterrae]OAJ64431.1 hypothetical protein A6V37_19610 [Paraburkholderia ginsengiterrae]